jgi:CRP-like cAMP-binding protein
MPERVSPNPRQNQILAALTSVQRSRLLLSLEPVEIAEAAVLCEIGDAVGYAYFPTSCIFSVTSVLLNGDTTGVALIGNDGVFGSPLSFGDDVANHRVFALGKGLAYRIRTEALQWELASDRLLQEVVQRYIQGLMLQIAQTVMCTRHHTVDQQLSRLLLLCLDRVTDNRLELTQIIIANILGVRREGVSEAAGRLSARGIISYTRGHILVTDRASLEHCSCECYHAVKHQTDRLYARTIGPYGMDFPGTNPLTLRHRAEVMFSRHPLGVDRGQDDTAKLVHELQIHQIELELQNEEIEEAYQESNTQRQRLQDLYGFAPVAYLSVSRFGVITQMNLAAAILLGVTLSECTRYRFASFVDIADLPRFNAFLGGILDRQSKDSCQLTLSANRRRGPTVAHIEAVPDEMGLECRMIVCDITLHDAEYQTLINTMRQSLENQTADTTHDATLESGHAQECQT